MQMPWRTEIIEGLLGADLVGFHLPGGAPNFLILSPPPLGADTSRASIGVGPLRRGAGRFARMSGRRISHLHRRRVRSTTKAPRETVRQRAKELRGGCGNPRKVLLGVDRLDYTKGICTFD